MAAAKKHRREHAVICDHAGSAELTRGNRKGLYVERQGREKGNCLAAHFIVSLSIACMILLAFLPAGTLSAQSFTGTSVGTVTDSTGAVVAGAAVTLTNIATGDVRSGATNTSGGYEFVNVQPGHYKLDVKAAGFMRFTETNIEIQVGTSTRTDARVQIGNLSQTVEVTSQEAMIETQQDTVGQVTKGRAVEEMPLNGRNVLNLLALAPGVVPLQNVQSSRDRELQGEKFFGVGLFEAYPMVQLELLYPDKQLRVWE